MGLHERGVFGQRLGFGQVGDVAESAEQVSAYPGRAQKIDAEQMHDEISPYCNPDSHAGTWTIDMNCTAHNWFTVKSTTWLREVNILSPPACPDQAQTRL